MNLLTNDLWLILSWWLVWLGLGLTAFPLVNLVLRKFWDGGYGFAKAVGYLGMGYLVWLGGNLEWFSLSRQSVMLMLALVAGGSGLVVWKQFTWFKLLIARQWKTYVLLELLFGVLLIWWSFVRSNAPEILGLEKFMDFGFINAVLRSEYLPIEDPWFAGAVIPYYYFNHFLVAVVIGLIGLPASVGYNLMVATVYALVMVMSFSLGVELWRVNCHWKQFDNLQPKRLFSSYVAGGLTSFLVVVAGNLDTGRYYLEKWFGGEMDGYDFPDATRMIAGSIHEFPSYALLIGDLHAHLLNMVGVLLFLAVSLKVLVDKKLHWLDVLVLGWLLGMFIMGNSWDMPIYWSLIGGLLVVKYWSQFKSRWGDVGLVMAVLAGVSYGVSWFFLAYWQRPWFGLGWVVERSSWTAWLTHWGGLLAIIAVYIRFKPKKLSPAGVFVLVMIGVALILIVIPEVVYVQYMPSSVGITDHRGNTMFKLSYQAWILLSIAAAFIVMQMHEWFGRRRVWQLCIGLFIVATGWYSIEGLKSYYNGLTTYYGLDGAVRMSELFPDDMAAVRWLNAYVAGSPTITEAVGDRYTYFGRVSSYTGLPTIVGWPQHEFIWRALAEQEILMRMQEADAVYVANELEFVKKMIVKYDIQYIFYGDLERLRFPLFNDQLIRELGFEVVFESGETRVYALK